MTDIGPVALRQPRVRDREAGESVVSLPSGGRSGNGTGRGGPEYRSVRPVAGRGAGSGSCCLSGAARQLAANSSGVR
jgi:hypothetical protein